MNRPVIAVAFARMSFHTQRMLTVYSYQNCGTCRNALKWLKEHGVAHRVKAIRETPPTGTELELALQAVGGDLRKLFNTSGKDYRELGLKDLLPSLSETTALALLAGNGNLVKRPLVIGDGVVLSGFKPDVWQRILCA
jgi:arsenate reductase